MGTLELYVAPPPRIRQYLTCLVFSPSSLLLADVWDAAPQVLPVSLWWLLGPHTWLLCVVPLPSSLLAHHLWCLLYLPGTTLYPGAQAYPQLRDLTLSALSPDPVPGGREERRPGCGKRLCWLELLRVRLGLIPALRSDTPLIPSQPPHVPS